MNINSLGLTSRLYGIQLLPCEIEYENNFYEWRNDFRLTQLFWNQDYEDKSLERLRKELSQLVKNSIFYIVQHISNQVVLGFVYAKGHSSPVQLRNLNVYVFINDSHRDRGYGVVASVLFMHYLFHNFDIAKLILEFSNLDPQLQSIISKVKQFKLEGIRPDHLAINGKLYDVFEYALSFDQFQSLMNENIWGRIIG